MMDLLQTGADARPTNALSFDNALVWRSPFEAAIRRHRVLLLAFAGQVSASAALCHAARRPLFVGWSDAVLAINGAILLYGAMALAIALVRRRPDNLPVRQAYTVAWSELRRDVMTPIWAASVLLMAIVLPISLAIFSAAKRAIPDVEPFRWDAALERFSIWLHGGRHLWEWLQPFVGFPVVTVALDRYYHLGWTLLVLGALALVVVSPISREREHFLTAWVVLTALCGTIAALALSSAGPPYFAQVVHGGDPYLRLRLYLRAVDRHWPLLSAGGRRALWLAYEHRTDAFGFGVSSMPSMHIATTALVACFAWTRSWRLGVLATVATIVMFVASVSLLWHYALDGYAGATLAIAIWVSLRWAFRADAI